uniref:Polyprotein n=1 Tax=Ulva picorna-like virus 3 TaxID=3051531 RepID=A0A9Y2DYV7_9VIRU|nr:MAG: polyprotein [Ulva picorna-like virus 3]
MLTLNKNPKTQTKQIVPRNFVFFDVSKQEISKYFLIDFYKNKITKITLKEFKSIDRPTIKFKGSLFKYNFGNRLQVTDFIKLAHISIPGWKPQSLTNMYHTIRNVGSAFTSLNLMCGKASNVIQSEKELIQYFLLDVASIFISVTDIQTPSVNTLIGTLLNIYKVYCKGSRLAGSYHAQSDNMLLAMALSLMPDALCKIVKKMSVFTNAKILDDLTGVFTIYSLVQNFLFEMCAFLPFTIPDFVKEFLKKTINIEHYSILSEIKKVHEMWFKNRRIIIEESFQTLVNSLHLRVSQNDDITEIERRSPAARSTLLNLRKLKKIVDSYVESSRIEPVCFVWEGPPGCMKSVSMNSVVKASRESTYCHNTKPSGEGKDFYDSYNNEDIFLMDDVGQMGVSQWKSIINFVSSTKFPLDCASVDLKDTKFFNSKKIFVTTNEFSDIKGISKTDCISNVKALWRRAVVFDYKSVKREGKSIYGVIQVKHFSIQENSWVLDFPADFKEYMKSNGKEIPNSFCCDDQNRLTQIGWMLSITNKMAEMKELENSNNEINAEDLDHIRNIATSYSEPDFTPQSWGYTAKKTMENLEIAYEVIQNQLSEFAEAAISTGSKLVCNLNLENFSHTLFSTMASGILAYICNWIYTIIFPPPKMVAQGNTLSIPGASASNLHNNVVKVSKQTFSISFVQGNDLTHCVGVCSGRFIITVAHSCLQNDSYIIVYKDKDSNHRIVDCAKVTCVFRDLKSDISVWRFSDHFPTPFKTLSLFGSKETLANSVLITPRTVYDLCHIRREAVSTATPYSYVIKGESFSNDINPDDIFYGVQSEAMCGCIVTTSNGKLLGIHVAGNSTTDVGCALRLTEDTLMKLDKVTTVIDKGLKMNYNMSDKIIDNFSGVKFTDTGISVYTPKKSNIEESPLYGVLPVTRSPANMVKDGPHTVKTIGKKSFKPVSTVSEEEIEFAASVLDLMIEPFDTLSMNEVINGTKTLAGMNKKSSNGYGCPKEKKSCLDYEKGELTPEFQIQYEDFLTNLKNGDSSINELISVETLKDEVRNDEKEGTPRSFRVTPLTFQILMKTLFGKMVENIIENKWSNQIMIGINPSKDWRKLYNFFNGKPAWAGDIKTWDGGMSPQVQQTVLQILVNKCNGDKDLASKILGLAIHCPVVMNDDVYVTTHSMPSGIFLTAILNSLVNKFYTAMWYYRNLKNQKPFTKYTFFTDIGSFIYGDDRLDYLNNENLKEHLNAITMKEFFESLGMGFTTANKQPIAEEFQKIEDISFLKRDFVYHSKIKNIVGPLDIRTIRSGLSWLDKTKESSDVLEGKLSAFQREIFLHEDKSSEIALVEQRCDDVGVPFLKLTDRYLTSLYLDGNYDGVTVKYGIKIT